jgi:hypothetical protein
MTWGGQFGALGNRLNRAASRKARAAGRAAGAEDGVPSVHGGLVHSGFLGGSEGGVIGA